MLRPIERRFHYASVGERPRNLADSTDQESRKQQIAATIGTLRLNRQETNRFPRKAPVMAVGLPHFWGNPRHLDGV
jgi:hypothetical protein